jgi:dynein heavy chain, axonemal
MMAKLFAGLSYTGSWTCLDEFNRISIEVLSVIAQQLITIRNAMLAGRETFLFDEKNIELNPEMGVFVTMNPGYKGRTDLPDNLKVLFRPVSMMIPDYALIAEIMLFSEGFEKAKPLSMKMTKLYKLASEQLSQQKHYDFGMRAVKSVLVMAGQLKRENPDLSEDKILIRAMRDSNIPKFLKDDIPLFDAIVMDLFPGLVLPTVSYKNLLNALQKHCSNNYLAIYDKQVDKILQFYETLKVRFGVMIVGDAMAGKTVIYETLFGAVNYLNSNNIEPEVYTSIEKEILNPKSISINELYGEFSHLTQEWTDGLASYIIRNFVNSSSDSMKWIIFDGPVDAGWIENMNTVLDDNMTLCLSNGERVKLNPDMKMIFECDNLDMASPATVSRCGMIYVPAEA